MNWSSDYDIDKKTRDEFAQEMGVKLKGIHDGLQRVNLDVNKIQEVKPDSY